MEVHPPEHPIHTWRDFFVHIATIVVGLLIAIGLEQTVELVHHRHLVHQAEANLHAEIRENRDLLRGDEAQIAAIEKEISADLQMLTDYKAHRNDPGSLNFDLTWNGMQSAAWDSARDTGAIALMPPDDAKGFSLVYMQQALVNAEATLFIRQMFRSGAPAQGHLQFTDLQPAEVDTMLSNLQEAAAELHYLRMLTSNLDRIYRNAEQGL